MFFAVVIWIVTLLVAAAFAIRRWWFPVAINSHASAFDSYFSVNLVVIGVAFVAVQIALGWAILRFRNRGARAAYSVGNHKLEMFWTTLTLALFLGGAIASARMWTSIHLDRTPTAFRVEVAAKQFAWSFRYAGADGRFGRTDLKLVNDAAGNPFGIDDRDPAGKDDVVGSTIRIPAGVTVELLLRSRDVIHNFFVRELRIKQDVVPGMDIPFRIRADRPGEYEIACSELCGLGHHQMRSVLIVMPPAEFALWLNEQSRGQR
jgi:cytochrome c oxidase subunit 2